VKLCHLPAACLLAAHIVPAWIGAPYETARPNRDSLTSPPHLARQVAGTVPTQLLA
jgi:glutathione S-transferase